MPRPTTISVPISLDQDTTTGHTKRKAKGEGNRGINLEFLCLATLVGWATKHHLGIQLLPSKSKIPNLLTRDEMRAFLAAMLPQYRARALAMYNAGLRKDELVGLTWDRVRFDQAVLVATGKGGRNKSLQCPRPSIVPSGQKRNLENTSLSRLHLEDYEGPAHGSPEASPDGRAGGRDLEARLPSPVTSLFRRKQSRGRAGSKDNAGVPRPRPGYDDADLHPH